MGLEESPEVVGWMIVSSAARGLAFVHHGLGKGDQAMLRRGSEAMAVGALWAKTCKGMLVECPRHVCVLEKGGGAGNVYQVKIIVV